MRSRDRSAKDSWYQLVHQMRRERLITEMAARYDRDQREAARQEQEKAEKMQALTAKMQKNAQMVGERAEENSEYNGYLQKELEERSVLKAWTGGLVASSEADVDMEKKRADEAEARLAEAEARIKELEAKLKQEHP